MTPDEIINTDTNITLLENAIENELPVSFRYWKNEDVNRLGEADFQLPPRRTVSPYNIKGGLEEKTMLVCWDHGREGIRFFDTDRIGGVRSEAGVEEYVAPVTA